MSSRAVDHSAVENQRLSKTFFRFWWLLALFPVVVRLFFSLHHLKMTWDDAAITTAFSRTWAETGRIALTPVSQTVEGFSSILWFLLLGIPYFFIHNPDAGLVWMKVLSAAFLLLSIRLTYLVAQRQFENQTAAIVSALLLAWCITTTREMENGMEMNLAAFLLLLLFHVLTGSESRRRVLYASIISFLLLLTRFEMPFTLALLFCGFFYAAWRKRSDAVPFRDLFKIIAYAALSFALIELWRHHQFGEWMPNTVYAKRFVPYSDWSTPSKFLTTRLKAIAEPVLVFFVPLVVAICIWIRGIYRKDFSWPVFKRIHPCIWILAFGCFLFGTAFGHNWGPSGRMVADMLPFLIMAIVGICVTAVQDNRALTYAFVIMLICHGLIWWLQVAEFGYGSAPLAAIEPIGTGADSICAALHLDHLTAMISDVGASSLCCERLNIVDSGLLTNPTLAHTGWKDFPSYFRQVRPELVETHFPWADAAHIYEGGLLDDYSIVTSKGVRFFLRNDLYNKLIDEHAGIVLPVTKVPACMSLHAAKPEKDIQFSLSKQTCLVMNTR